MFATERDRKEGSAMAGDLSGKRIAFLATDGVEQVELTEPWDAIKSTGATCDLVSLKSGEIQGFEHHDRGRTFAVDRTVSEADPSEYDGLVLPGGVISPDILRMNGEAVRFVWGFFDQGKPVAAICHGPWTLVEADVVRGRTLTSWPSLKTDIRNAGGTWVDEQVNTDGNLVTSRKPADLPAFCKTTVEAFA
jgi:protease I